MFKLLGGWKIYAVTGGLAAVDSFSHWYMRVPR